MSSLHGILAVVKPKGMLSTEVVKTVKRVLFGSKAKERVGHGGTLDRLASGVLVIGVGRGCRELHLHQAAIKEYVVGAKLGISTPSGDLDQPITSRESWEHVTRDILKASTQQFVGEILQMPPQFCAKKVGGTRASNLARIGLDVPLIPRPTMIYSIDLLDEDTETTASSSCRGLSLPDLRLRVVCGGGTYMRSLVRDISAANNTVGVMTSLVRTRVCEFRLTDAHTLPMSRWTQEHMLEAMRDSEARGFFKPQQQREQHREDAEETGGVDEEGDEKKAEHASVLSSSSVVAIPT